MPNDPSSQPTQPITDAELAQIQFRAETCEERSLENGVGAAYDSAADVPRLLAERNQLLTDLQWYISDLGPEHWQNCDGEDCYLCEGHVAIRDLWKDSRALGLDQDGNGNG